MKSKLNKNKLSHPNLVEVTLAKDHTHAGRLLKKGEKIKVSPERETWLKDQGVIQK